MQSFIAENYSTLFHPGSLNYPPTLTNNIIINLIRYRLPRLGNSRITMEKSTVDSGTIESMAIWFATGESLLATIFALAALIEQ
jgi:hypothetical protein